MNLYRQPRTCTIKAQLAKCARLCNVLAISNTCMLNQCASIRRLGPPWAVCFSRAATCQLSCCSRFSMWHSMIISWRPLVLWLVLLASLMTWETKLVAGASQSRHDAPAAEIQTLLENHKAQWAGAWKLLVLNDNCHCHDWAFLAFSPPWSTLAAIAVPLGWYNDRADTTCISGFKQHSAPRSQAVQNLMSVLPSIRRQLLFVLEIPAGLVRKNKSSRLRVQPVDSAWGC